MSQAFLFRLLLWTSFQSIRYVAAVLPQAVREIRPFRMANRFKSGFPPAGKTQELAQETFAQETDAQKASPHIGKSGPSDARDSGVTNYSFVGEGMSSVRSLKSGLSCRSSQAGSTFRNSAATDRFALACLR